MKPRDLWVEHIKCPFCNEEQVISLDVMGIKTRRSHKGHVAIELDIYANPNEHKCLFFAEEDDE